MNTGKICVSICAETVDDLVDKFRRAEAVADIVEVRFDCLGRSKFDLTDAQAARSLFARLVRSRTSHVPIIATLRTAAQGGRREFSAEERTAFWNSGIAYEWQDLEEDLIGGPQSRTSGKCIASFHDFSGVSTDVASIYNRLRAAGCDAVKIAIQAKDAADAIALWKMLEQLESGDKPLVPIAMGEAGKWTRILGLAYGAPLTYASLDEGNEAAPGQITADDMLNVYRVKQLDKDTDIYGIIAGNTSYSLSPYLHNAAFNSEGMNSVFVPFQMSNIDPFFLRMVKPGSREVNLNFRGFAVTNPHKRTIMRHLDHMDEAAKSIGAVNTLKIANGQIYGSNTDAEGFIRPLVELFGDLADARVAIVGAGGAARACIYSLVRAGADVTVHARNPDRSASLAREFAARSASFGSGFSGFDIIVNATPLGTKGEYANETIANAADLDGLKLVYDLNYNPPVTPLMREAAIAEVPSIGGAKMLVAQAAAQFKIWTGFDAPLDVMLTAVQQRLSTSGRGQ